MENPTVFQPLFQEKRGYLVPYKIIPELFQFVTSL
jgi:hypothetical protein